MLRFKTKTVNVDDLAEITFLLESDWVIDSDWQPSSRSAILFIWLNDSILTNFKMPFRSIKILDRNSGNLWDSIRENTPSRFRSIRFVRFWFVLQSTILVSVPILVKILFGLGWSILIHRLHHLAHLGKLGEQFIEFLHRPTTAYGNSLFAASI